VERPKGLPIGNSTSQFFANYYLSPLDHFVKEKINCKAYLRYVDDFVLFSHSKKNLHAWKSQISYFLQKYRLNLHPTRCQIYPAKIGRRFLGQVIFKMHRRLPYENVQRFKKRLREWAKVQPDGFKQRIDSWLGHAGQANTYCLIKALQI